jgi:hypothetical protein
MFSSTCTKYAGITKRKTGFEKYYKKCKFNFKKYEKIYIYIKKTNTNIKKNEKLKKV